jgi:hypothetical protein
MTIHEKNLIFLKAVAGRSEADCEAAFALHKRDMRLALFDLLKPEETDKASLLQAYKEEASEEKRMELLPLIFGHFCPNPRFREILLELKQRKTPKLDPQTEEKFLVFRRGPNKEELNILFDALRSSDIRLATKLLQSLQDFGRESEHLLNYIMMMGEAADVELAKAALMLIPHIPAGIEKALMLYWQALSRPELRFHALNAMQAAKNLNPDLLFDIFTPILQEYERLCRSEGEMNSLWPEFNMIRNILSKNGGAGRVWVVGKNLGIKK